MYSAGRATFSDPKLIIRFLILVKKASNGEVYVALFFGLGIGNLISLKLFKYLWLLVYVSEKFFPPSEIPGMIWEIKWLTNSENWIFLSQTSNVNVLLSVLSNII